MQGEASEQSESAGADLKLSRYRNVDLSRIQVKRATSQTDFDLVAELRRSGFSRVIGNKEARAISWIDQTDRSPGVFTLLGFSSQGQAIATMRIQDSRIGSLELQRFVDVETLISHEDKPVAQFSRLTASKGEQSVSAMFGLFKAGWLWCMKEQLKSIVIATPHWSKPIYDFMLFNDLGPLGRFKHQFAGDSEHVTMKLPVQEAEYIWRRGGQPLCAQFTEIEHADLVV